MIRFKLHWAVPMQQRKTHSQQNWLQGPSMYMEAPKTELPERGHT